MSFNQYPVQKHGERLVCMYAVKHSTAPGSFNSSQMASAGAAHLAYRDSFSQEALNWIGKCPQKEVS